MKDLKERDLKQLSAYLDGELDQKESSRLELRLKAEPRLREALRELDATREMIRVLPQIRPPRNFTLTPEMAGVKQRRGLYPVFRLATVVAAFAFAVLVGMDTFLDFGAGRLTPPALVPEVAEVAEEMEAESLLQAPSVEEVAGEEASDAEMRGTEGVLGAELPQASMAETTETVEGERFGLAATQEPLNDVTPPSESLTVPSTEQPPVATPKTLEERAEIEMTPAISSQQPTVVSVDEIESEPPPIEIAPILAAEIGLGVLAVILGVVTVILRRQT